MAKVTFASLKVKNTDEVKTFNFNDKTIEVRQYLPSEEKNNLILVVIQKASEGDVFNTFALDVFFNLMLVMKYTNITFTDSQKADLLKLYDALERNGIVKQVVDLIPEEEYSLLISNITQMQKVAIDYFNSINCVIDKIQQFAPDSAEKISKEVETIDPDALAKVFKLAELTGIDNNSK